jgi:hypothetical protein
MFRRRFRTPAFRFLLKIQGMVRGLLVGSIEDPPVRIRRGGR